MPETLNKELSNGLRHARVKALITRHELAERLGITDSDLEAIENGVSCDWEKIDLVRDALLR